MTDPTPSAMVRCRTIMATRPWWTVEEVADATGLPLQSARDAVKTLRYKGEAQSPNGRVYALLV